jgi:hypothetical protein
MRLLGFLRSQKRPRAFPVRFFNLGDGELGPVVNLYEKDSLELGVPAGKVWLRVRIKDQQILIDQLLPVLDPSPEVIQWAKEQP